MLPVGCLFIALFVGFKMNRALVEQEFHAGNPFGNGMFQVWYQILRWVAPITIVIVFLYSLGIFELF